MAFLRLSRRTYAFLTTLGTTSHRLSFNSPATVEAFLHRPILAPPATAAVANTKTSFCLFSSSAFQAPDPPTSQGVAVFPDVDISKSQPVTESATLRNSDPDAVFVVNGASRGIGLKMVQSLLERTQGTVIACCRDPSTLHEEFHRNDRVDIVALDLEDQSTIDDLQEYLKTNKRINGRVDALLNVAGILGDGTPGPERSLARVERDWLEHSLQVNVVGHVMLIKALRLLLKSNAPKAKRPTSIIVNLSARVGSISDNELGGWYSYRLSKAALNQATRTMAHELKRQGTHAIAIHPGTTDTDLSKPFQRNVKKERLFPVDFTVNQILDVVDHLEENHAGGLYDWAGKAIPF